MFENREIQRRPSIVSKIISPTIARAPVLRGGGTPTVRTDRAPMGTQQIAARPSIIGNILSPSREMLPFLRGGGALTVRTNMPLMGAPANIPLASRVPAGMGGAARNLPTGRSVVSPVAGDRTGIVPPSTFSTQGAFGGESGGLGAAAAAAAPASGAADLGLGGIGESISSFGNSIVDTVKEYIPLAIKIILAVIIIKIVLWLLRGRR